MRKARTTGRGDQSAERENQDFIHGENLRLYRGLLAEAADGPRREILLRLLAEEEAKGRRPELNPGAAEAS
jgi:hypothetical protein